ncbi:MAG: MerR family transcriptional regulator [Dermatophilaceae bacterium]
MLTIGQLAAHAGVTVRTVHHYHHTGLLPEPERDHSGYRRYDAAAVVELIRIRTLADAGVPLSRVRELLAAGPEEFADAINDIDHRLQAEIRTKQEHRRRIARLAAGDSLALPPDAIDYLDRLRQLGLPDRMVDLERDAWILIAAQMPEQMPTLMALKKAQLDDPVVVELTHDLLRAASWPVEDPRLCALADRVAALCEADAASSEWDGLSREFHLDDQLVELLDSVFLDTVPIGRRLLQLLEERGWTGWTRLERVDRPRRSVTASPQSRGVAEPAI